MMSPTQLRAVRRETVHREAERIARYLSQGPIEAELARLIRHLKLESDAKALAIVLKKRTDVVMSKDWRIGRSRSKYMHAAYAPLKTAAT